MRSALSKNLPRPQRARGSSSRSFAGTACLAGACGTGLSIVQRHTREKDSDSSSLFAMTRGLRWRVEHAGAGSCSATYERSVP